MDTSSLRPVTPERSWLLGVRVAAATTVVLGLSLAVDGSRSAIGYALVAVSGLLTVAAITPAGRSVATRRRGWLLMYAWPVLGILALLTLMVALDRGPVGYVGVLTISVIAAAGTFPRSTSLVLGALTLVAAALAWTEAGVRIPAGQAAAAGLMVLVAFAGAVRATAVLGRSTAAVDAERHRAETRNRLLVLTGRTVSLDIRAVADQLVEGAAELGFEMAAVTLVVGEYRIHIATHGIGDATLKPVRTEEGLSGRAIREGRSVWVEDYSAIDLGVAGAPPIGAAVAVPILDGERAIGTIMAARRETGVPDAEDLTVLEVLAQHAGHAFANAYRYRDEQQVVDRLRDLDTLKRSLVSNVTHDLRTPLASVHGIAETLTNHADDLDPDVADHLLDRIGENVDRLSDMVHRLLDLRSASSDEDGSVELAGVVEACVRRLGPLLGHHVVSVTVPRGLAAATNIRLLDHVLENLLSNAAKYTPAGTSIVVAAERHGSTVRLSVSDDGPGIEVGDLDRVTQKFFRGAAHRDLPGTGLGLSLVEAMLEEHGSALRISSVAGEGSRFAFDLPHAALVVPLPEIAP